MYQTVPFLKLVTLALLITVLAIAGGQSEASAAQLTLSWTDNANNEDGFRIERKTGASGTYATIASIAANTLSYVDGNLPAATTFCYRLNAYNAIGPSGYSNEQCGTTPSPTYLLTVNKAGAGSGTVTATGINCGSDCSETVNSGTQLVLTATAATGSTFAGWSGTGCSGTVTVTGNMSCTATFNLSTFTLTVAKAGTGSGTVTATGINCGSDCSETVNGGTQLALTATAAAGSTFVGWSGTGCSGTVTVTGNMSCTATFNSGTFTLTIAKSGTGSGTVTATGINCGSDCSETVNGGTQVALTATAASGSTFAGWSGTGCSGSVTVTGNMTCTATFDLRTYTLTVAKKGTGSGTVTGTGIDCGSDCSEVIVRGTQVALTAMPEAGSSFAGWTGTACTSGKVTVTSNVTCTATFYSLALVEKIGLYRPSTGEWFLDLNGNSVWDGCAADVCVENFDAGAALPVVGEWDGTGLTELGLYFPASRQWYLDKNANETWEGCDVDTCTGPFGIKGDMPVAGKWTASGYDRQGVFRPSTGYWYLDKNSDRKLGNCSADTCAYLSVYLNGDLPVVGDWNGNGVTKLGLFRPSTGQWFLDKNGNRAWNDCSTDRCINSFGEPGDLPVAGDWSGSGASQIGVFRPSTGEWFLDFNGNGVWDGCAVDICVAAFGTSEDIPLVGKW
jgi:hypothetical protein